MVKYHTNMGMPALAKDIFFYKKSYIGFSVFLWGSSCGTDIKPMLLHRSYFSIPSISFAQLYTYDDRNMEALAFVSVAHRERSVSYWHREPRSFGQ